MFAKSNKKLSVDSMAYLLSDRFGFESRREDQKKELGIALSAEELNAEEALKKTIKN